MTFSYSTNTIAGRITGFCKRSPVSTLRRLRVIWAAASVLCETRSCTLSAASGVGSQFGRSLPQFRLRDRFVDATRRPIPSECIPRRRHGAVKVGGSRERTSRVREWRHQRILGKDASCSHNTNQLGTPDATSGEPFHLPSGSSLANDAAACRRAGRHRLRLVFTGGTPRGSRRTLVSTKI
jgi:hypothetical protein